MYVIAYILDPANGNASAYYIHALDLSTLTDKVLPRKITASGVLSSGTPFSFNPTYQRQRSGLLLANGNVYAGFGSFCDWGGNQSRGWVLGLPLHPRSWPSPVPLWGTGAAPPAIIPGPEIITTATNE